MFGRIAPRYDLLNTLMTLGRDSVWRRSTAAAAAPSRCNLALDMATGSGELAFLLTETCQRVIGVDICPPMLELAQQKAQRRAAQGKTYWLMADGLDLPFPDNTFDCATTGFALRNVANIDLALQELCRVLKPGGRLACLELTPLPGGLSTLLPRLYIERWVPLLGRWVSGDGPAYQYLPASVHDLPDAEALAGAMRRAGFAQTTYRKYNFGSVAIHVGLK